MKTKIFFRRKECDDKLYDETRILYSQCRNIDGLRKQFEEAGVAFHFGDCISMPTSCSRCSAEEDVYCEGKRTIEKWNKLKDDLKIFKDLSNYESIIQLLCVLLPTKQMDHIDGRFIFHEIPERYELWNSLSEEEKVKNKERATRFRQYFEVRPIVEGIPWW